MTVLNMTEYITEKPSSKQSVKIKVLLFWFWGTNVLSPPHPSQHRCLCNCLRNWGRKLLPKSASHSVPVKVHRVLRCMCDPLYLLEQLPAHESQPVCFYVNNNKADVSCRTLVRKNSEISATISSRSPLPAKCATTPAAAGRQLSLQQD